MSKESHSFSVSVACEVGVNCSIILQHFIFLQRFAPDGWVKKPAKAIKETYQYMTEKEIRGAIDRLCRDGYVFDKIENSVKADRTKSFFVTDSGHKLYGTEPFDKRANGVPKRANGFYERANDNFPKGQMLIKEDCIVNSPIVGGSAPAPDVETFSLNADFSPFPPVPAAPLSPAIQGPSIRDFVKADTPGEMLERIAAFYATPQGQNERDRIYSDTIAGTMSAPERTEVTKSFAAWAVEQNYGQKTFRELNARFTRWWKDQARYNSEKKSNQSQQQSPLNSRPDGPVTRSTAVLQK